MTSQSIETLVVLVGIPGSCLPQLWNNDLQQGLFLRFESYISFCNSVSTCVPLVSGAKHFRWGV